MNIYTRQQELLLYFITNYEFPLQSKEYIDILIGLFAPPVKCERTENNMIRYKYLLSRDGKYQVGKIHDEKKMLDRFRRMVL